MIGIKLTDDNLRCGGMLVRSGWTRREPKIVPCKRGIHWIPRDNGDPLEWMTTERTRCRLVLDAEGRVDSIDGKAVSHRVLIGDEITDWPMICRLAAADYAASVLDLADGPTYDALVETVRRYARGEASWDDVIGVKARVEARARARVWGCDSANASANASASASARDRARDSANASAWDSASASAWDSVSASAWDSASARARARDSAWASAWAGANARLWHYVDAWVEGGRAGVLAVEPWPRGVRLWEVPS